MNITKYIWGAALLTLAASCAQEETMLSLQSVPNEISYKVDAGKMSRSASSYENGTDIDRFVVSAWVLEDANAIPAYGKPVAGNTLYFLNDEMTRVSGEGTFNYTSDARYWPRNGEILDFYSFVDFGPFKFDNITAKDESGADVKLPGFAGITQQQINVMPDMLFSTAFNQTQGNASGSSSTAAQKNVSFRFDHALAKVAVTAEVKNQNLHVVITDMSICGVTKGGDFTMTHKAADAEAENGWKKVDASWAVNPDNSCNLVNLLASKAGEDGKVAIAIDKSTIAKQELVGSGKDGLLVIPNSYKGAITYDNGHDKELKTYIQLKAYAYNKANKDSVNPKTDFLIYGEWDENKPVPLEINLPIDFNWAMGTCNHYNIIFDCGNGGDDSTKEPDPDPENPDEPDPNNPDPGINPTFMRIGYEVTVTGWEEGETKDPIEYNPED